MNRRDRGSRELGGSDPLDTQVHAEPSFLTRAGLGALAPLLRSRAALGLRPALAPVILILPLGFVIGPQALGLISFETLGYFDTAVTVALAVLGVFVGMAFGPYLQSARRLIVAASIEAVVTIAVVAGACVFLLRDATLPGGVPAAVIALCLGIAAAASSASNADPEGDASARVASRVADLDDVVPILLSGGVLLATGAAEASAQWRALLSAPAIGLSIGAAGWLLFEKVESAAERGALLLGALALLGGAPAYLGASPLVSGFTAGLFWTLAPGRADRIVADDLRKLQHPLVMLLLLTAGAMCVPSPGALWLIGPYVLFRIAGKLAGGWLAVRLSERRGSARGLDLGIHLIPPGVIGVAFALGFMQILPPAAGTLLITTVAAGSILCELAAFYVIPTSTEQA